MHFQMLKHSPCSRHSQWMFAEGACEKRGFHFRIRIIPISPQAAINFIHIDRLASNYANWHTTTDELAIGNDVCLNTKPRLRSTRMKAETSDAFIENQSDTCF